MSKKFPDNITPIMPGSSRMHPGMFNEGQQDFSHPEFPQQVSASCADECADLIEFAKTGEPGRPQIDWTKPIEARNISKMKWTPVNYVGPYRNYHIVVDPQNEKIHRVLDDQVRNTPAPRECEAWVNVYERFVDGKSQGFIIGQSNYPDETEAQEMGEKSSYAIQKYITSVRVHYKEKVE